MFEFMVCENEAGISLHVADVIIDLLLKHVQVQPRPSPPSGVCVTSRFMAMRPGFSSISLLKASTWRPFKGFQVVKRGETATK